MRATKQAQNQTIVQHGLSVWKHTRSLIQGNTEGFRLPQWYLDHKEEILDNLHDYKTIKHYNIWHDMGKPYCRTIDDEGKQHFPDHANKSAEIWNELFPDRPVIGNLIKHDMKFHLSTINDILECKLSPSDLCTLMITALAELHSNATMFGGITSTSFIIKWKKLDKLGKKICDKLFNHAYMYVLVRNDLSKAQQAVQSAHAAIESSRRYLKEGDEHPSVILCSVKNENKLMKYAKHFEDIGVDHVLFREPDIGNAPTALASRPLVGKDRQAFSRFQLLT
jgi:hypothetical protein